LKIIKLLKTDSTNNYAKKFISYGEDVIITAKTQSLGKGSKGRKFSSKIGGLYLSRLKFYSLNPDESFKIMISVSMAVIKTLEYFGFTGLIKWPNDIYINDKKVCGILIENSLSNGKIISSIAGIGINVNNKLPPELLNTAVSLKNLSDKKIRLKLVRNKLIENLDKEYSVKEYIKNSMILGKNITVVSGNEIFFATAESISDKGELIVVKDNKKIVLNSGEVSIKI